MATLKQRLHRKNSSGTYDTIHLETGADCITGTLGVAHGGTGATTAANARTNLGVEEALEAKISHTDEFTAEMQDLHGNARGLLVTVPSAAGPDIASINAPPDVNWGTCLSLQAGSIRTLMLIDSSGLWIQYYNGQSWSAWQKMLSDIGGVKNYRYVVTIPTSSWNTNSAGGKYRDITVSGMKSSLTPCVGIIQTSDVDASELMISQFAATIRRIEPMEGKIRVYTYADGITPSVNISIQLVGTT